MRSALRPKRSLLVYSALDVERWDEAMGSGADVVMFDLEDGTAESRKDEARPIMMSRFAVHSDESDDSLPLVVLRINSPRTAHGLKDMVAVLDSNHPPAGLVLPKVGHREEVRWVAELLRPRHRDIELVPLIEDQAGVAACTEIATASPMVSALFLGAVDLSGALRSDMSWEALYDARAHMVRAASAAEIDCIDGPWLDVHDEPGLREEVTRVARMGFTGKASYDPSQLEHIHAGFTPSAEQIAWAEQVVTAVRESPTGGARVDGRSVNEANAKGARRVLARARRAGVLF